MSDPHGRRRGALLYNPAAGKHRTRRLRDRVLATLRTGGWTLEAAPTVSPGHATELARELAAEGVEAIFALGGDGTLREVAAGLLGSDTTLAPLPGGTANVVCRAVGLPSRPLAAARRLCGEVSRRRLAVGLVDETPFLMQVSVGLDAAVVDSVDERTKRRWGRLGVLAGAVPVWWRYDFPSVSVRWDDREASGSFVAACNIALYGGGFRLAPEARGEEASLQLVVFAGRDRLATLGFAADVALGRHLERRDVTSERIVAARIEAPAGVDAQIDGDALPGSLPLSVGVADDRLLVLTPV